MASHSAYRPYSSTYSSARSTSSRFSSSRADHSACCPRSGSACSTFSVFVSTALARLS